MKILVAVTQAAQLDEDFELREDGRAVEPDSVEYDLNEWDAFAVEEALLLRERAGDGEVVVVTVGDEEAEEALLTCLAKGADRGVRIAVDDPAELDAIAVARLLAEIVAREKPTLVLCGVQSSDASSGATGVALAALAGLPRVAVVRALEWDGAGPITVERELEGGLAERMRIGVPALLTIQTGINEPRYANLRAIKQAREKPIELLDPEDLGFGGAGLENARGSRVLTLGRPDGGTGAEMLDGDPDAVAARIAAIVKSTGVGVG